MSSFVARAKALARQDLIAASATPTLSSAARALIFSPQVQAVWTYRLAHFLHRKGPFGKVFAKLCAKRIATRFGCYISPEAVIGPGLSLPHPTGVVIGIGSVIGANVTIYQNVTIGVRNRRSAAYPVFGDGVTIFAGAVVVGEITVGARSIIGANAVVLASMADDARAPAGHVWGQS